MRRSLLNKPITIHIEVAGAWYDLESINAEISTEGARAILHLDLSKNFKTQNKTSHKYIDAIELSESIQDAQNFQLEAHGAILNGLLREMQNIQAAGLAPQAVARFSLGSFGEHSFDVSPSNDEINLDLAVVPGSHVGHVVIS